MSSKISALTDGSLIQTGDMIPVVRGGVNLRAAVAALAAKTQADLTADVTGTLPIANGGTGATAARGVVQVPALGLTIDPERREALLNEKALTLSRKEFDLLLLFASHPGRVFDRQTLLGRVWGEDSFVDDRTVDVHIRRLRKALNDSGEQDLIRTVRAAGYSLDVEEPIPPQAERPSAEAP